MTHQPNQPLVLPALDIVIDYALLIIHYSHGEWID